MADFGLTVNSEENRNEFSVLKAGWYHMQIIGGDVKNSSTGGTYVEFKFKVVEGEGLNRQVFGRFNIVNANPEAARIGKQQLISLADAVGITDPSNTEQFLNCHCMAQVTVRPAQGQYAESNEIKAYKKYEGTFTPSATTPAGSPTAPSAPTARKPSWLNK